MAGPTAPAPEVPKPKASETETETAPVYPIESGPGEAPTWVGGVQPVTSAETDVRHARSLRGARTETGEVSAAAVSPRTWDELIVDDTMRASLPPTAARQVVRSPIIPEAGASLTACAKGDYRDHWEGFARALNHSGIDAPTLDLDGDRTENPKAYAACYRQVAAAVKGVLPKATMQWTVTRGNAEPGDPLASWPGDDAVDIVGVKALDTGINWSHAVNGDRGLNWWADFARRRGARIALSAWGPAPGSPQSADNAAYVQNIYDWLARTADKDALAYELYTESADARSGAAATAYRALFR